MSLSFQPPPSSKQPSQAPGNIKRNAWFASRTSNRRPSSYFCIGCIKAWFPTKQILPMRRNAQQWLWWRLTSWKISWWTKQVQGYAFEDYHGSWHRVMSEMLRCDITCLHKHSGIVTNSKPACPGVSWGCHKLDSLRGHWETLQNLHNANGKELGRASGLEFGKVLGIRLFFFHHFFYPSSSTTSSSDDYMWHWYPLNQVLPQVRDGYTQNVS